METLLFLSIGLIVGALSTWFIAKYKFASESRKLSPSELQEKYVLKEVFEAVQNQTDAAYARA